MDKDSLEQGKKMKRVCECEVWLEGTAVQQSVREAGDGLRRSLRNKVGAN